LAAGVDREGIPVARCTIERLMRQLYEHCGDIPPAEAEDHYYDSSPVEPG